MKTISFKNGDQLPIIGLGTWKARPGETYQAVREALTIGYRHIDCAPIYGNEAEVGRALNEAIAEGTVSREQLWLTSKLWNSAHAPEDVRPALQRTLEDLRVDYLDLYLIHWPVALKPGVTFHRSAADLVSLDELPLADTWKAMEGLVEAGLCRHLGVSNFSIAKISELLEQATMVPEMNQIELHPYLQQKEMLDFCEAMHIHLTAYAPLGSADRPAALKQAGEPVLLEDPVIGEIATSHGVTPAQVLISWAVERGTAVIPKTIKPQRLLENLQAADLMLTVEDQARLASLDRHRRYVSGDFWVLEGGPYTMENLWDE